MATTIRALLATPSNGEDNGSRGCSWERTDRSTVKPRATQNLEASLKFLVGRQ